MAEPMAGIVRALADGWAALRDRALEPVHVAVLDSGIDGDHPDLREHVASAVAIDLDEGRPAIRGLSTLANNDEFGHGTSVAGIIVAIAPNVVIHDVRVLGRRNVGSGQILLGGFEHALSQPWRLLNLSLAAGAAFRNDLLSLCERAYFQDQIIVAARRNMPLADNGFPAEFSSCIGVDRGGYETPFDYAFRSRTPIEFVARGEAVVAPARGGGYTTVTGTSFATPAICGLCALLLGAYPELKLFEIKTILRHFAKGWVSPAGSIP